MEELALGQAVSYYVPKGTCLYSFHKTQEVRVELNSFSCYKGHNRLVVVQPQWVNSETVPLFVLDAYRHRALTGTRHTNGHEGRTSKAILLIQSWHQPISQTNQLGIRQCPQLSCIIPVSALLLSCYRTQACQWSRFDSVP